MTLDDNLNISNAINDPIKLNTIIDWPISIKYLRPYLSKNSPLKYVIITWNNPSYSKSI